ncbi:MAG TPA: OFA family MFS transporter [Steroidobacteraceae bacterium]|nr:OFA family MFS transporter [Steroidobacteraceae bacterium]
MSASVAPANGFLSRERIVAGASFNRWLVPPAALAIHLCIGMAYGFSVFWLPLSKSIGITQSVACPKDMGTLAQIFSSTCDWKISMLAWTYTIFFVFLGASAATWGGWLERAGPRKAGVVSAVCWCGGLVISAVGVMLHQIWLLWLGSGVIGGIGLGLGYISPVSTLIKWFPDRRGMATGMAIMGFGGGAMIGSPLAARLMKFYATTGSVGVWQTFLTLAAGYFVFMICGALGYRVPRENWQPAGWQPAAESARHGLITSHNVHLDVAWRTPQFWLLWAVLCLNVTAGIGILGMASPLLQEVFAGQLIGVKATFTALSQDQLAQIALIAAGFTGLLSLFNIAGRIFWASLSDRIGRKVTYAIFFLLGLVLYASIPWTASVGSLALFVAFCCVIVSMYGGGFATVPAYLADMFGTKMVGAIHGRLLTAWSAAGVLGPVLVTYIREYQIDHGVERAQAYSITMYILAVFLAAGFVCNWLVRPVDPKHYMKEDPSVDTRGPVAVPASVASATTADGGADWIVVLAWLAVWIPIGWGVWVTLQNAVVLFR